MFARLRALIDLRLLGLRAEAEIVEGVDGAERGGDAVIGEEQQRPDDAENARPPPPGGVDAAPFRI